MVRPLSYLRAIVIVHGKSEKQMCDFIKSKLRIRLIVESDKKGEKSIQINSVMNTLNGRKFRLQANFFREFEDAVIYENNLKGKLSEDFRIFIIMDTDDCSEQEKKAFINKEMFRKHWAYSYIYPIYNTPDLECVLKNSKIKFVKEGEKCKKEYIKIFPTDKKYQTKDCIQIDEFSKNLHLNQNTNMDEFINYCLEISKQ